jgi:hypothetical protein
VRSASWTDRRISQPCRIRDNIIPPHITKEQEQFIYASEADVLNIALFDKTAKQRRDENPGKEGNFWESSNIEQLLIMANMECLNAEFIRRKLPRGEWLKKLNNIAIQQLKSLTANTNIRNFSDGK